MPVRALRRARGAARSTTPGRGAPAGLGADAAKRREPVRGTYRGREIVAFPPPASGGVHLIEMLNILEAFPIAELAAAQRLHLMTEAMRRAYRDRAEFLADPD